MQSTTQAIYHSPSCPWTAEPIDLAKAGFICEPYYSHRTIMVLQLKEKEDVKIHKVYDWVALFDSFHVKNLDGLNLPSPLLVNKNNIKSVLKIWGNF